MKLNFLGDVYLDKAYKVDIELDNFIFNLESPLSTFGEPKKGKIILAADKSYIQETFRKFPLAINLANNHIMDYGEKAYVKTLEYLDKHNIKYFGAGNEENNFNNPSIINYNEKKIALLGYCCPTTHPVIGGRSSNGSALLEEKKIINDIKNCKQRADYVVINLHWGDEGVHYPKPSDVQKSRQFIEAGADLIVGHHAHVIQSFEKYMDKYIFYGLGHFLFPYGDRPAYYDGEKFQKIFSPKCTKANRQSVMVELDEKFNITNSTTIFEDGLVELRKVNIPRWIPESQRKYSLYYKFWQKQIMMKSFLKNPKIPMINQIKNFLDFNY